MTNASKHW